MKKGDIVYCIDKTSKFTNTRTCSLAKIELDKPYTINNSDCGNADIELVEHKYTYYAVSRFISECDYRILKRKEKLEKLLKC